MSARNAQEALAAEERSVLGRIWSDRRVGLVVGVGLAASGALVAAWLTPRGAITTPQALGSIVGALLVGIGAGLATGSRWSMLLAPIVFMAVFEVARMNVDGPTVDDIRLGSIYGIFAFVFGRGLHGILVLLPMALGASYGVEAASRLGRSPSPFLPPPRRSSPPTASRSPAASPNWRPSASAGMTRL